MFNALYMSNFLYNALEIIYFFNIIRYLIQELKLFILSHSHNINSKLELPIV